MIKTVSFRTDAFVTSGRVDASRVSEADPEAAVADDALVAVDALVRGLVVRVAGVTLAPEAADRVHADAVLTHSFMEKNNIHHSYICVCLTDGTGLPQFLYVISTVTSHPFPGLPHTIGR